MTEADGGLLLKDEDGVTPRNMLRQTFSMCLSNSNSVEETTTCPTFTFDTLAQQSINKEKETRIINNNLTAEETTSSHVASSSSILQPPSNISAPTATSASNTNTSQNSVPENWRNSHNKPNLRKLRSASFDGRLLSYSGGLGSDDEHYDVDDDDTCSITTNATGSTTTIATNSDVSPRNRIGFSRKQLFPRTKSQRLKLVRDRPTRAQSSSCIITRNKTGTLLSSSTQNLTSTCSSGAGVNRLSQGANKQLRRCESAVGSGLTGTCPAENNGNNLSPAPLKRQGTDYLVEIDGKVLSFYGQGALKHALTGFPGNVTCTVTTAKFHYIAYDTIIPFFGKMRQIFPALEHFRFRANNIETLSQLNSLSDLQGLTSLHIQKEGNPLVSQDSWLHYVCYRLSHWGLQNVNGKEVSSEYRGGQMGSAKCFESLGFLALSCLPQTALTPLAKRLHMLHCFCCCSPSSSSDESAGKAKSGKPFGNGRNSPLPPQDQSSSSSNNICTSWDDDPVLLDVIGKEALVYCPSPINRALLSPPQSAIADQGKASATAIASTKGGGGGESKRKATLDGIIDSGVDVLEKLDRLEKVWPSLMTDMIQEILLDFMFMDNYMKKELKKCSDNATIALHKNKGHPNS